MTTVRTQTFSYDSSHGSGPFWHDLGPNTSSFSMSNQTQSSLASPKKRKAEETPTASEALSNTVTSPVKRGRYRRNLNTNAPPRRSRRLIEKDTVDERDRSPGRMCEPKHREELPLKSSFKRTVKLEAKSTPGFYSPAALETYLNNNQNTYRESDLHKNHQLKSRIPRRIEKKSVSWLPQLEW